MGKVVTFGEIMIRIKPRGFLRFRQALPGDVEITFGGAEANVAASVAMLGGSSAFVTALPDNPAADACLGNLRGLGVDTSWILRSKKGRFGIYYVEAGANQRPSNVVYDRENSAIALEPGSGYDWKSAFQGASWFHVTGITPSLSRNAADASLQAVKLAKELGLTVSCDLNFRKKLWKWEEGTESRALAGRVMRGLLAYVDILISNEEDAKDVLGIEAGASDFDSGVLDERKYEDVARQIVRQFPNIRKAAFTLRRSHSATRNDWGGMLYDAASDKAAYAPMVDGQYRPYPVEVIVDRIGGGDAFGAGLIHALMDPELRKSDADAAAFAAAASCLCHSIEGDFNYTTREEVLALMGGKTSGRINR